MASSASSGHDGDIGGGAIDAVDEAPGSALSAIVGSKRDHRAG